MASSQARTPPKKPANKVDTKQANSAFGQYQSEANLSPIDRTYERYQSPNRNGRLNDLQKLKLEIQKDIWRQQLRTHNPENTLVEALSNYCILPEDALKLYQSEVAFERNRLAEVIECEQHFMQAERQYQEKLFEIEKEEAEVAIKSTLSAEKYTMRQLEGISEENTLLRVRLQAHGIEHQHEVHDLENKRMLERVRTESILNFEQQKTEFFAQQLGRLTNDLADKNRQIERLTKQSIEKDKALQQQRIASEEEIIQAHNLRDNHLQVKNKEFQRHEDTLKEDIIELKKANAELQMKCSELSHQLSSTKHELEVSQHKVSQLTGQLEALKLQLADTHDNHTEELTKVLEARNKMLSENRRINRQPQHDNHKIIQEHDNTIEQLKKSFERETGLLKKDVLSLKIKLVEKQHELEDIVARYQPLLESRQSRVSGALPAESANLVNPSRTDISLLEILTERYRPRVLG